MRQPNHRSLRRARLARAIAITLCAFALPGLAPAQDSATEDEATVLDAIVVTAQKREQQIQDVPISISAYSGEFLEDHGIDDYGDLADLVPGLDVQMQSASNPSIAIRGITSDANEATVEPRISLFQDGVSISRFRGSLVEMYDLARVEVLRGPQGTLFGRAAQNGALHLIQNKPRDETSSHLRLGLGDEQQRLLDGHYNSALADSLFGRVAMHYEQRDGYVDNLSGGSLQGKDTFALRASLRFLPGEDSRWDLIVNHQQDTPPGTLFRSGVIPTRAGSLDLFDGSADLNRGDELGTDREVSGASLLGDVRLNDRWSLSSITGWRRYDLVDKIDSDGSQLNLVEFDEDADGRQFSQELRFNYDNGGNFTGFIGASYFRERNHDRFTFNTDERSFFALVTNILASQGAIPPQFALPLLNADLTPFLGNTVNYLVPLPEPFTTLLPSHSEAFSNDSEVAAWDVFADGTWRFGERWELSAGLRLSRERVEYGYQSFQGNNSSGMLGLIPLTGRVACPNFPVDPVCNNILFPATNGRLSASRSDTSGVGRVVLRYEFNDRISGYGSVSRGRRPGMVTVSDLGISDVPAEIVLSYEIGLKGSNPGGWLSYDLSLFQYDYSDFQAQVLNPAPPPFFVTTNAGNASAQGLEVSLLAEFSESVSGWFNYGYIDASFDRTDDAGNPQLLAGNRFRLTPKQSVSVGMDWQFDLGGHELHVRPSYNYRSHVFFEDQNQPGIEQEGYGLWNLRASLRLSPRWELGLYGSNLANEKYLIDAGNTGLLFGIPTFIPGPPRQWGLSVTGRF